MVAQFNQEYDCADIYLNTDQLKDVIKLLEQYLDRDYFEDNAESIWTYEEYLVPTIHFIANIKAIIEYMKSHPDVQCYFYDSY